MSTYQSLEEDKARYKKWEEAGYFKADAKSPKPKYCVIMPPPNVTGVLHMGHALMCTLEDILTRWKRMQGFNTLWLPGTDHAGIATQMVVERQLQKEEHRSRHDLGREKFLEKVWQWKEFSQNTILNQLRLIGSSCDWSRLTFTLDEDVSHAVRECFYRLYQEGLIYRSEAITSWCPRCRTALSDLEVKFKENKGSLWHIRYPQKGEATKWLTVATTRPETLLGDTAVAIHPEDDRFLSFHSKTVLVPLVNREVPVVTDTYVDREFGTGALKITPGHDANDYEVGKRHKLAALSIFDDKAQVNAFGGDYQGLSREKAREKVLEDLTKAGLLEKVESYTHSVGHCDRCATIVEPKLSAQWFVNAGELAKEAIRVVEEKEIRIFPEEWEKTYFEWMRNIRPWCISRQLWWGHRIPVWYCEACSAMTVAVKTPTHCSQCKSNKISQDEDVLDTWFSSGLWPLSTLGWPNPESPDLKAFYPTDVLETGFDILFFWVARMIMLGIKMSGKIPFREVYLHPMVRDEYGQKMSKTKGNVKDPLDIINRLGADPLRFFLASNAFHGRDLRVSEDGVEACRNFVTKIHNAFNLVSMHFSEVKRPHRDLSNDLNGWIWTRLDETREKTLASLEKYRFFEAAQILYQFVWTDYCSYFLEFIKTEKELKARKTANESTAVEVLEEILRLLHPFMPFETEKIWEKLPLRENTPSLVVASYPKANPKDRHPDAARKIQRLISIVDTIRTRRGISNLAPAKEISVILTGDKSALEELKPLSDRLKKMVRASEIRFESPRAESKEFVVLPAADVTILLSTADLGGGQAEAERVRKEMEELKKALNNAENKLRNERFVQGAPAAVVEGVKKEKERLEFRLAALQKNS